jgi:hypothetical protein
MTDRDPDNIVPFRKLKRADPKRFNAAPGNKQRTEPAKPFTISPLMAFGAIVLVAVVWVLGSRLLG